MLFSRGRLAAVKDAQGRETRYEYSAHLSCMASSSVLFSFISTLSVFY
ncbi:hypothetical protein AHW95_08070 [Salmonella enterica subsp. enterica]|nr:hypothetical protein [Salmonella enterica subsp. enterica]